MPTDPSTRSTRVAPSDRCGEATRRICACSLTRCPAVPPAARAGPVPLGTMAVTDDPGAALEVGALGSCIGLVMFDPSAQVAAMAHVFLPSSHETRRSGCDRGKFADTVVPTLLDAALRLGARRERLGVYLAGGAQLTSARRRGDVPTIGAANEAAVREQLSAAGLRPTATRTGGEVSRSLRVDLTVATVTTRAIGGPNEHL